MSIRRPPLPVLASIALAALVVVLALRVRSLRAALAAHEGGVLRQPAGPVGPVDAARAADGAPPLFIVNQAVEAEVVPAPGVPIVLFISASGCHACPEAREPWRAVHDLAESLGIRALAIHIRSDAPAGGVGQLEPPGVGEPCRFVGPLESLVHLAPGFPACVVIDAAGRVRQVLVGVPEADGLSTLLDAVRAASG